MSQRKSTVRHVGAVAGSPLGGVVGDDMVQVCAAVGDRLQALSGSTLLVAGGGGFLPSYLVDAVIHANDNLLVEPCRVVCVDNFATGLPQWLAHLDGRPDFICIRHDLAQPLDFTEPVDYIIHAASIASPPVYRQQPLATIDVNVSGTRNLLELARESRIRSFLYLSSSEVYGDPPPERIPTPETYWGNVSFTGPRACYDESKRLAETLCSVYRRQFGLPVKVARPFNVYGPRLRLDDGRIIPDLLRDALAGRPLTLHSDGRATRSFCYVADAAAALLLLLLSDCDGEAFNVGNDEQVPISQVADQVAQNVGGDLSVQHVQSEDADYLTDNPQRRCPDLNKVEAALGWRAGVTLAQGLARTVRWYREEGQQ